jgi:uncharacterized protein
MADKGHQGFASTDEERRREIASEGGHASHEKGAAHEFTSDEAAEAGRKGNQARNMAHASRESGEVSATHAGGESTTHEGERVREGNQGGTSGTQNEERSTAHRQRKTRGGTHDQHVTAGKKGGSRIRQLIELGYKYEEEHGIGPGRNERSKMAARRRASKTGSQGEDEETSESEEGGVDPSGRPGGPPRFVAPSLPSRPFES